MKIMGFMESESIMSTAALGAAVTKIIQGLVLSPNTTENDVRREVRNKYGVTGIIITYHPTPDVDGFFRDKTHIQFEFSAIRPGGGEVRGRTTL